MLTARNVFSWSLTISAASGDETGITCLDGGRVERGGEPVDSASMPPTTFGVLVMPWAGLPGSIRSGAKARKKSTPAFSPVASNCGRIDLAGRAGVGGAFEDDQLAPAAASRQPARWRRPRTEMSGSRVLPSGVGTQMLMMSASRRRAMSVVAVSRSAVDQVANR